MNKLQYAIFGMLLSTLCNIKSANAVDIRTPATRKYIVLAPIYFQFSLWNNNAGMVSNYLSSVGYTGDVYIDKEATVINYERALTSEYSVVYINTHGANNELCADPFPLSDYTTKITTLTAACSVGDETIFVQSTAGFPDAGEINIYNSTAKETLSYKSKTANSFAGLMPKPKNSYLANFTTVEWTAKQQAFRSAVSKLQEYLSMGYTGEEIGISDAGMLFPAYFITIRPQFVYNRGRLNQAIVYADACSSAGNPDLEATEWENAFHATGATVYMGYNVDMSGIDWPIYTLWLQNSSPRIVNKIFSYITDGYARKTIGDAYVLADEQNLVMSLATSDAYHITLMHVGDMHPLSIPSGGNITYGLTYPFTVSVTNPGQYAETYQVNLAIHDSQYHEITSIIEKPVIVDPHSSKQVELQWPVDSAHGVSSLGTYYIGIGLWPENPNYQTEPILDVLGYYAYTLSSFPLQNISGRVSAETSGSGIDGVSVVFSAGAGTATTAGGGYFSHPVPYGWSGTVTPSLNGWQFSPGSISYNSPVTQSPTPVSFIGSALPVAHIQTREDALSVEEGHSNWIGVRLSQDPGGSVVVTVQKISGDADLTVSTGSSLTFNSSNWQTYQSARIDAAEDSDKLNGMATIRCSASGWAPKDVVVTENDNDGGWVRVIIEPAPARTAGAQWRINQGAWHNSGETAYSAPWVQDFTIQFKDVPGWFTPPTQKGLLNSFTPSLVATGTYIGASSGEGSLTIRIMPDQAISAGGRWRADGGAWRNSGDVAYGLSAGTHTVEYEQLAGYIKPANQSVNINGGNLTENYGIFSPTDTSILISPGDNIQNAVNNASAGHTIVLNPGTYNITTNIFITKGVTLRSLNGPASTTVVLPGTRIHCISVGHSNAVVDGITFTGADYWQSGEGGGAYCSQGIMLNCVSSGNIAGYGAGFFCGGSGALYNCWADNNQAYYGGGGLYIIGNGRAFSCVAKNNTVRNDYEGGGIYAYGGYVSNCLSTGNGTGYNGDGAGGYFRNTVVDRSVFAANTAHDAGGGCVLGDNAVLRNALIENNTADNGGGIYVDGSTGVRIESCAIRGNRATGFHGGAGWCRENTLISNCVVVGNASGQRGGAFAGNDRYSVVSSVIASNTAGTQGGAIYAGYEANLVNCLIFRNTATDGGGVWDYTGSAGPSINGCTIVYNHATGKGGGIYSDGNPRAQMIRNSIVMSNTASSSHPNYFEWDTGDLRYEYSCASPLPAGAGNINSNPKFVNSSANDYRLQSSSPCIDKGTATGAPSIDIAGVPRPLDGDGANGPAHDMGAYEYAPPSGSVIVRIEPVYAIDAGAKWSLDGVAWRGSDEVVDYVAAGPQTIVFSNISGWAQPAPVGIAVVAGSVSATNGTYLPLSADTDGDEIPDEWEIEHFGRLTNVNFSSDFDGDHLTDYYEQLAGTDPRDPTSCLVFTEDSISAVPGLGVSLRWYSGTGVSYRVCRTTNLVNGFQVIAPVVSGASPMTFYTDPSHSGRTFFYRIEKNP